ncbi:MAG: hypothetical protein BGO76_00500 [Caedibacter sp. 38-128]|nr:LysR family transcriptional regulator [Holosporales bacterium]OJX02951.1 MAG: hypothetical protein BGO76_00500 [Caedibacter sp. 38-128]
MDKEKLRQIDLDKLQNFYSLFREGSIAKASAATGVSRRTYYHDLAVLEAAFNTKLYLSGKKSFVLTDEGRKLADFCKSTIDSLSRVTKEEQFFDQGNLIIHTTPSIGAYYFPEIIRLFRKKYPNICIDLLTGAEYFTSKHHDFDVSIGPYLADKRDLSQHLLNNFEYGYFASQEYLAKYGTPETIQDLKNHNFLCYSGEHLIPLDILEKNKTIVKSNLYIALLNMCLKGVGICSLPLDLYKLKMSDNKDVKLIRILPNTISENDASYFSFYRFTKKEKAIRDLFDIIKNLVK